MGKLPEHRRSTSLAVDLADARGGTILQVAVGSRFSRCNVGTGFPKSPSVVDRADAMGAPMEALAPFAPFLPFARHSLPLASAALITRRHSLPLGSRRQASARQPRTRYGSTSSRVK